MNPKQGVILYGPPASGKDTVTAALTELNPRYAQFARLKVGAGKSAGYRMGTAEQLRELEAAGDVVYANTRYGNTYVIDRPGNQDIGRRLCISPRTVEKHIASLITKTGAANRADLCARSAALRE